MEDGLQIRDRREESKRFHAVPCCRKYVQIYVSYCNGIISFVVGGGWRASFLSNRQTATVWCRRIVVICDHSYYHTDSSFPCCMFGGLSNLFSPSQQESIAQRNQQESSSSVATPTTTTTTTALEKRTGEGIQQVSTTNGISSVQGKVEKASSSSVIRAMNNETAGKPVAPVPAAAAAAPTKAADADEEDTSMDEELVRIQEQAATGKKVGDGGTAAVAAAAAAGAKQPPQSAVPQPAPAVPPPNTTAKPPPPTAGAAKKGEEPPSPSKEANGKEKTDGGEKTGGEEKTKEELEEERKLEEKRAKKNKAQREARAKKKQEKMAAEAEAKKKGKDGDAMDVDNAESSEGEDEGDESEEEDGAKAASTKKKPDSKKRKSPTPPSRQNPRRRSAGTTSPAATSSEPPAAAATTSKKGGGKRGPAKNKNADSEPTVDPFIIKPKQKGRGNPLSYFKKDIVKNIDTASYDDLMMMYRLLFTARHGRVAKKDVVPSLLQFSGYLPPLDDKLTEEEQAEIDSACEVRNYQRKRTSMMVGHLLDTAASSEIASSHLIVTFLHTTAVHGTEELQTVHSATQESHRYARH